MTDHAIETYRENLYNELRWVFPSELPGILPTEDRYDRTALFFPVELGSGIEIFHQMGMGGFHMHVRTGLKNQYLSDEYMELIKACVDKAKSEDMLAWLYDEDRWPSGAAGGLVTKDKQYRARNLMFTSKKEAEAYTDNDSRAEGGRSGEGKLLACYDVVLDKDGYLEYYKRINDEDEATGTKWYAFLEIHQQSSWYNDQSYLDTLNKNAVEKFVEVTHEKYKEKVGDEFDGTVPAIFTDEPQFTRKMVLGNSFDTETDIMMPWTDKVPEIYKETYGEDIFDTLVKKSAMFIFKHSNKLLKNKKVKA